MSSVAYRWLKSTKYHSLFANFNIRSDKRHDIFTALKTQAVIWVLTSCGDELGYQYFGETRCLHLLYGHDSVKRTSFRETRCRTILETSLVYINFYHCYRGFCSQYRLPSQCFRQIYLLHIHFIFQRLF